jgi:exodeoxyribonuclease-3
MMSVDTERQNIGTVGRRKAYASDASLTHKPAKPTSGSSRRRAVTAPRVSRMRVVSWNVNGIRAVLKKGFVEWLRRDRPDVVCLQETKALEEQVPEQALREIEELGYKAYWHSAERKGYSGVATLARTAPLFVTRGVPFERGEGRVLVTEHGDFTLYNIYFPNGRQREDGPDPERLSFKLEFYDRLLEVLEEERAEGKNLIISGDWNTAHAEIDLARPKENVSITGFLPEERESLQRYVDAGYVDTYRHFRPAETVRDLEPNKREYTWWTYRAGARERNVGWRIDYHFVNGEFLDRVKGAAIHMDISGSDHCPLSIELRT